MARMEVAMRILSRAGRLTALALTTALVLTACGDGTADTDDDAPPEDTADDAADGDVDEPEPVTEGAVEVPVWIAFTDYRLDWARDVAAAFGRLGMSGVARLGGPHSSGAARIVPAFARTFHDASRLLNLGSYRRTGNLDATLRACGRDGVEGWPGEPLWRAAVDRVGRPGA
jgi:hypothetical protein